MRIAGVTVTYNDDYKFNEWFGHYLEYKDELSLHIIVDNGSKKEYIERLEKKFINSVIIRRKENGGSTAATNDGIRYALKTPDIDAIMVIGNDIRLEKNSVSILYNFLYSRKDFGMVAPVLLARDSDIIEDYGCSVSSSLFLKPQDVGKRIENVSEIEKLVEVVTGGMNMAKPEFYEAVGLQDESLFMYSDEVDASLRCKKTIYKMAVTKAARSWHQHINPSGKTIRMPYVGFLISRNKLYLAYKHFHFIKVLNVFSYQLILFMKMLFRSGFSSLSYNILFFFGMICGLLRIHKNFSFIIKTKQ